MRLLPAAATWLFRFLTCLPRLPAAAACSVPLGRQHPRARLVCSLPGCDTNTCLFPAFSLPSTLSRLCLQGGDIRELDFRFFLGDTKIGAPFHGLRAFFTTSQVGAGLVVHAGGRALQA